MRTWILATIILLAGCVETTAPPGSTEGPGSTNAADADAGAQASGAPPHDVATVIDGIEFSAATYAHEDLARFHIWGHGSPAKLALFFLSPNDEVIPLEEFGSFTAGPGAGGRPYDSQELNWVGTFRVHELAPYGSWRVHSITVESTDNTFIETTTAFEYVEEQSVPRTWMEVSYDIPEPRGTYDTSNATEGVWISYVGPRLNLTGYCLHYGNRQHEVCLSQFPAIWNISKVPEDETPGTIVSQSIAIWTGSGENTNETISMQRQENLLQEPAEVVRLIAPDGKELTFGAVGGNCGGAKGYSQEWGAC